MFSTIVRAKERDESCFPDIDESKMEQVLGELASEAENIAFLARFARLKNMGIDLEDLLDMDVETLLDMINTDKG